MWSADCKRTDYELENDKSGPAATKTVKSASVMMPLVRSYEQFGLRTEEAQRHAREVLSSPFAEHRTYFEWLARGLQNMWTSIEMDHEPTTLYTSEGFADALCALGLTDTAARTYATQIVGSGLSRHRTLDEWILKLLVNTECMLGVGDSARNGGNTSSASRGDSPSTSGVDMTASGDSKSAAAELLRRISECDVYKQRRGGATADKPMLLFHGTQLEHAQDIRQNGINIHMGQPKQNFSNADGFYVARNAQFAVDYARAQSQGRAICVLVYESSLEELREQCKSAKFLDLFETTDRDVTIGGFSYATGTETERKKLWESIVSHYSSGCAENKEMTKGLQSFEFIRGPWAADKKYKPRPLGWKDCVAYTDDPIKNAALRDTEQICIKSDDLAKFLTSKLLAVVTVQPSGRARM